MEGNKESARLCLAKALSARNAGDQEKAKRLVAKAVRLDPGLDKQGQQILSNIPRGTAAGPASGSSPSTDHRTKAAQRSSRGTASPGPQGPPKAEATGEQKKVVNDVRRLSRDYYKMLGVDKTAPADKIKKAYHKLARKCHPDKNPADGAEEAFKALQTAYETLSDDQKRAAFDRFGIDGPQMGGGAGGGNPFNFGGAGHQFRGGQGFGGDVNMDDLFRHIFQGGAGGGGMRFGNGHVFNMNGNGYQRVDPRRHQQHRRQASEQESSTSGWAVLLQILPFLLLFFMNIMMSGTTDPEFMLSRSGAYQTMHKTSRHDVTYYTQPGYTDGFSRQLVRELDATVENTWVQYLNNECDKERQLQKKDYDRYWWKRDQAGLKRVKNRKLKKCDEYKEFRKKMRT